MTYQVKIYNRYYNSIDVNRIFYNSIQIRIISASLTFVILKLWRLQWTGGWGGAESIIWRENDTHRRMASSRHIGSKLTAGVALRRTAKA